MSFKKCFIFFILIVLANSNKCFGQYNDLGSWNILNVKYKYNEKLTFFGEAQLRSLSLYHNFHYYEYKGGIDFQISKQYKLTFGIGDYNTFQEGGNFKTPMNADELRIWPQIALYQTIGAFKLEQRYRFEMRYFENKYNNRFRYRLAISKPFGKEKNSAKPFEATVSNDFFFTDNEPYFVRNRLAFQLFYKLQKQVTIMTGYLHQFDYKINDETGRDFLMMGLFFECTKK